MPLFHLEVQLVAAACSPTIRKLGYKANKQLNQEEMYHPIKGQTIHRMLGMLIFKKKYSIWDKEKNSGEGLNKKPILFCQKKY